VLTIMSYNGRPVQADWGQNATPGPIDIAAIQLMYGAVHNYTGDTVYTLQGFQGPGTYYQTIWDTGGVDTIQYNGAGNATIDLRPAWLGNGEGGGGFLSSVESLQPDGTMQRVDGGFLIAADITGFIPETSCSADKSPFSGPSRDWGIRNKLNYLVE
jgi:hypothetical protein